MVCYVYVCGSQDIDIWKSGKTAETAESAVFADLNARNLIWVTSFLELVNQKKMVCFLLMGYASYLLAYPYASMGGGKCPPIDATNTRDIHARQQWWEVGPYFRQQSLLGTFSEKVEKSGPYLVPIFEFSPYFQKLNIEKKILLILYRWNEWIIKDDF